jgi:hypothetical protein
MSSKRVIEQIDSDSSDEENSKKKAKKSESISKAKVVSRVVPLKVKPLRVKIVRGGSPDFPKYETFVCFECDKSVRRPVNKPTYIGEEPEHCNRCAGIFG